LVNSEYAHLFSAAAGPFLEASPPIFQRIPYPFVKVKVAIFYTLFVAANLSWSQLNFEKLNTEVGHHCHHLGLIALLLNHRHHLHLVQNNLIHVLVHIYPLHR